MNQRPFKGKSLLCLPRDYTVIDIETNMTDHGMEPIEIAALRVRDGKRAERFDQFVRPSRRVDPWITALTGITDEMVRDAPTFGELWPWIEPTESPSRWNTGPFQRASLLER